MTQKKISENFCLPRKYITELAVGHKNPDLLKAVKLIYTLPIYMTNLKKLLFISYKAITNYSTHSDVKLHYFQFQKN
jgi:hypothetical protein